MTNYYINPLLCNYFILLALLCYSSPTLAQPNIPNPIPGVLYVQCMIPDQFETVTEQVLVREASKKYIVLPPIVDTISKKVMIEEAYTTYELQPATFTYKEEQVMIQDSIINYITMPATYDTIQEYALKSPGRTDWRQKEDSTCLSANPKDCFIYCLEEIPAVYELNTKIVVREPASIKRVVEPPVYKTMRHKVVDQPAKWVKVEVPAKYKTVKVRVIRTPATVREVEIPAEYKTIETQRLLRVGGFTDYVPMDKNGHIVSQPTPPPSTSPPAPPSPNPHQNSPVSASIPPPNTNAYHTESYDFIKENKFTQVLNEPRSTFSIDVDKAAYSNVRRFIHNIPENVFQAALTDHHTAETISPQNNSNNNSPYHLPPKDAVRIEEMINYFEYDYPAAKDHPIGVHTEMDICPWNADHHLLHIALQGKELEQKDIPPHNLVFLLDVSGSMNHPNKLPLLRKAFKLLVEHLREEDKISIVVYAGAAGMVLPPTSGKNKSQIIAALDQLKAGGSTAGGKGLELAYQLAKEHFQAKGNNRIILATDGDFNIGPSSDAAMIRLIESHRDEGIYITTLGFGMGNYKDDKLEKIAQYGNGNYAYIDNFNEARKVLVTEGLGTLFTIAKDVKIQIEFNPAKVKAYRLVGYENRLLEDADFEDDKVDAGEIGVGHSVTALYEVILADGKGFRRKSNPLKYQQTNIKTDAFSSKELAMVQLRYKLPADTTSQLIQKNILVKDMGKITDNFRFASAVAAFGLLLRDSEHKGTANYTQVLEQAKGALGKDKEAYRREFLILVEKVKRYVERQDRL